MERPPQHITDSLGQTQMRAVLEPLGWTVNRVEHDYGVDFDIEVFTDFKSTGISFKIQLKSSESSPYSAEGGFISQEISVHNADYLCRELRSPVILVHADVNSGRTFWSAPQLDVDSIKKLSKGCNSGTITLRIPIANELSATIGQLIESVARVEKLLATRLVVSSPIPDFVSSIKGHIPREKVIQGFKDKADTLRLEQAQEMLRNGEGNKSLNGVESIFADPLSSIEMKFSALLMKERIQTVGLSREAAPQPEVAQFRLTMADELQHLTKKGPRHLKFYALIVKKAAELGSLVHKDWGLFLNWRLYEDRGDIFWKATLVYRRSAVTRRIVQKYNQCIRLAQYATNSKHRWALPEALLRIATSIGIFILRLSIEGLMPDAERFSASGLQICKLVAWISAENGNEGALQSAVMAALLITPSMTGEAIDWAQETISRIEDNQIKQDAQSLFDRRMRRMRGETFEGDIQTTTRQIVENMAIALGIDLSDPNDQKTKLVEIGIKDADPCRVLKNCEHIFVSPGPHSPLAITTVLANRLGLPSI